MPSPYSTALPNDAGRASTIARRFPRLATYSAPGSPESVQWLGYIFAALSTEAVTGLNYSLRRTVARNGFKQLFGSNYRSYGFDFGPESEIRDAIKTARDWKAVPPSTRDSLPGLRDAMTLPALLDLLTGRIRPAMLISALSNTTSSGTPIVRGKFYMRPDGKGGVACGQLTTRHFEERYGSEPSKFFDALVSTKTGKTFYDHVLAVDEDSASIVEIQKASGLPASTFAGAWRNLAIFATLGSKRVASAATTTTTTTGDDEMEATTTAAKRHAIAGMSYTLIATAIALQAAQEQGWDTDENDGERRNFVCGASYDAIAESTMDFRDWVGTRYHEWLMVDEGLSSAAASAKEKIMWANIQAHLNAALVEAREAATNGSDEFWPFTSISEKGDLRVEALLEAYRNRGSAEEAEDVESEADNASDASEEGGALPTISIKHDPSSETMLNAVLTSAGLPKITEIAGAVDRMTVALERYREEAARWKIEASKARPTKVEAVEEASGGASMPEGSIVYRKAGEVFNAKTCQGLKPSDVARLNKLEIPMFEWSGPHPDVPQVDENYIFRFDSLLTLLWSLASNKQPWIQGHTGSGKSTLVEQVAAHLQWPLIRVNFDSEISRLDLIGRDTLVADPATGSTVTRWVDGVLPKALRGPYILLLDEIDFVRPDVGYALQPMLEGNGLVLNENGGERVRPHVMSRLVATANTVGQGDEFGLYQGARPQSSAMLDRFRPFIKVPYLSTQEEVDLIKRRHPGIDKGVAEQIGKYVEEHREAFTRAQIMMPLSPRGIDSVAEGYATFYQVFGSKSAALKRAFSDVIESKAAEADRVVISGLIKRIAKS